MYCTVVCHKKLLKREYRKLQILILISFYSLICTYTFLQVTISETLYHKICFVTTQFIEVLTDNFCFKMKYHCTDFYSVVKYFFALFWISNFHFLYSPHKSKVRAFSHFSTIVITPAVGLRGRTL